MDTYGQEAGSVVTIIGWALLVAGTVTFVISLANSSLWVYWLRFLALGFGVLGYGVLKTSSAF